MFNFGWQVENNAVIDKFIDDVSPDYIIASSGNKSRLEALASFENYQKTSELNFAKKPQKERGLITKVISPITSDPGYGHYRSYTIYSRNSPDQS
jgi:hypothetical protein